MDFIKAVSIIGRDLEEAIALLDQLAAEGGSNFPEIELARLRVRSAAELLRILPGLSGTKTVGQVQETVKEEQVMEAARRRKEEPVAEEIPVVEIPEPVTAIITEPKIAVPVTEEIPVAKTAVPVTTEIPVTKAADPHKTQDPQKTILADRFVSTGTLGEKMQSAKPEGAISSVMQNKPIADIGAAIGMNDKFYFIRELFSGDSIAYHDTIRRLNIAASLGEAMKILDESTVMGSDPSAQSSFVDVVRRKFNIHV
ncbi:MAG: hypothetical protein WAV93_11615 [Bacteroidales bacterium]